MIRLPVAEVEVHEAEVVVEVRVVAEVEVRVVAEVEVRESEEVVTAAACRDRR